jgi:hypothetical protein
MRPTRTISKKQLAILTVLLIGVPIGFGLMLSFFTPRMPEPALPALVRLESKWFGDSYESRRLLPCISIKNTTKCDWLNLSIGLNKQFYCDEPKGIKAGLVVSVPLEAFVARMGSVRFPVGNRDIKTVIVFAQIETGERAVAEYKMPAIPPLPKKTEADAAVEENEDWVLAN